MKCVQTCTHKKYVKRTATPVYTGSSVKSELARTLNPQQEGFSFRLARTGELRLSEANRAGAKKTKRDE